MAKVTFTSRRVVSMALTLQLFISLSLLLYSDRAVLAWQTESLSSRRNQNILLSLIRSVGWEPRYVEVQHLDQEKSAFCNTVYRLTTSFADSDTTITIAKIFSPLALARMAYSSVGTLDSYVASQGLAPRIFAKTEEGILMEFCESDCCMPNNNTLNAEEWNDTHCALSLAKLHSLPPLLCSSSHENNENMLWRSCRILMVHVDKSWVCSLSTHGGCWTKEMLELEIRHQKGRISRKALVEVAIAHGDCKPANIIRQCERVLFIDLELCGRNYRAYDLAKFLRNDQDPTLRENSTRRTSVLTAYAQQVDADVHQLQFELNEILPLTWLEAAIFFAAMEAVDPRNREKWNSLAASRLRSYEMCRRLTR